MKKRIQTLVILACMFTAGIADLQGQAAQNEKKERAAAMAKKMQEPNFVFAAQEALPMGGRVMQLTSYYEIQVKNDTLISSLPYFGRVFTAPMNPADGGYMFTASPIDYKATQTNNGKWEVVIVPAGRHKGEKFLLTAFSNGSASLQVTSNDRQPITYRGIVKIK